MTTTNGRLPSKFMSLHEALELVGMNFIPNWMGQEVETASEHWGVPIGEEPSGSDPEEPHRELEPTGVFSSDTEAERAQMQIRFKAAVQWFAEPIAGYRLHVFVVNQSSEEISAIHRARLLDDAGLRYFVEGEGLRGRYCVLRTALEDLLPKRRGPPLHRFRYPNDKIVMAGVMREMEADPDSPLETTIRETMIALGVSYLDENDGDGNDDEKAVVRMAKRIRRSWGT